MDGGDGKGHVNRLDARNRNELELVRGHEAADLDGKIPRPAINRRGDDGVPELHARGVDGGLLCDELRFGALDVRAICLHHGSRRICLRPRLLAGIPREDASLDQLRLTLGRELLILGICRIAVQLCLGLREQRFVARHVGVGLSQCRFERPAIQREEALPRLDEIALVERNLLELTGHLRTNRDRRVRFDVADRGDVHRHVFLRDLRDDHRRITAAAPPAASTPAARWHGACRGRVVAARRCGRSEKPKDTDEDASSHV